MTVRQIGITTGGNRYEYIGLSTDIKPIADGTGFPIGSGSKYLESDGLKRQFKFDGVNWINIFTPPAVDERGYAISITPEHYRLHNGEAFSATAILSNLAAGATMYLEYVIPANKTVAVQGFNIESDRLIKSEFFEAPTVTDGTSEVSIVQRYRSSNNAALMKIYTNPTNVSGGTLLRTLIYGVMDGQGNSVKPLPPSGSDPYGFNLKPGTKYVVKLTNMSSSTTTLIYLNVDIYEF